MAVKFKNSININDQYTFPSVVGTDGQYLSITDAAAGTLDWTNIGDIDGLKSNFIYYDAKNSTGSTIPVGTAVMAVGTDGNSGHILIAPMVADGSVEPKYFIGVTDTAIANGVIGKVVHFGLIDQVNTNAFSDGQVLWCDPANPGGFTTTEPTAPAVKLASAIVINSSTNGKLLVRVQGNEGIHELHDVKLTSITDGDTLVWDDANGYWKNGAIGKSSLITDNFTGDDSTTVFTLSSEILSENNTSVYFDGVYQSKSNYSLSGDQLTFTTAPPSGTSVEIVSIKNVLVTEPQASDYSAFYPLISDLDAEETARIAADNTLQSNIDTINAKDPVLTVTGDASGSATFTNLGNATLNLTISDDSHSHIISNVDGLQSALDFKASISYVDTSVANLIDSAPGALDTLNELAAALGDDANFSTTVTNALATKIDGTGTTNYVMKWLDSNTATNSSIFDNGTNVGIGTSSPATLLHLKSTSVNPNSIRIENSEGYGQITSDANVLTYDASQHLFFNKERTSEYMRIASNGYVGIGTNNPIDLLHINSNTSDARMILDSASGFDGELKFFENGSAKYTVGYDAATTNFVIGTTNVDTNQRLVIDSSGNVGIGTTNPSQKLDVAGNIRSYFTQTGTTKIQVGNSVASANDGAVFEAVYGSTKISALGFNWTGAAFESYLDFYGRLDIRNQSDSNIMSILAGGNVGIGTTDPQSRLDVAGAGVAVQIRRSNGYASIKASSLNSGHLILDSYSSSGAVYLQNYVGGNIYMATGGGNVGIGTTDPNAKLEVKNSLDDLQMRVGSLTAGISPYIRLQGRNTANTLNYYADILLDAENGKLFFNDPGTSGGNVGTNPMVLDSAGNVGIGTSSPIVKLEVFSSDLGTSVNNTTNQAVFSSQNANVSRLHIQDYRTSAGGDWTTSGKRLQQRIDSTWMGYMQFNGTGNNGGISFGTGASTTQSSVTEKMRITSSGNVGIGITTPAEKLTINGKIKVIDNDYDAYFLSKTRSDNTQRVGFQSHASGALSIHSNNSERIRIDGNGNVGINTQNPQEALEIYGGTKNILIQNTLETDSGIIFRDSADPGQSSAIKYGSGDNALKFYNASSNTERMRLESDGDLHVDGDVIAYSTTVSDERLKDNITTIDNALDKVCELRGVEYDWNASSRSGQHDMGVIAQEVEKVFPFIVREKEMPLVDGNTYKTVDYEKLVGVLIEAVKELTDKVNKLEAK